jgi:hypothetical protein
MLVGPIDFSLTVTPAEDEPDFAVATITAVRTDGRPLDNSHVFVQPADLVIDHGAGSVSISLSRDEIRQGLGRMAIRIKDKSGQLVADVALIASAEKDGAVSARLGRRTVV